jgi:hypothetical protein
LLRAIARNEDITQDLSTLENPAIIEQLRGDESAAAKKRSEAAGKPAANKRATNLRKLAKVKKAPARKVVAKKAVTKKAKKAAPKKAAPKKKTAAARRKK